MSNLRTICRPHTVFTSFMCCRHQARSRVRVSFRNPDFKPPSSSPSLFSPWLLGNEPWFRVNQRRTAVRASSWTDQKSPYETLGNIIFRGVVCWNRSDITLLELVWYYFVRKEKDTTLLELSERGIRQGNTRKICCLNC